MFGCQTYPCLNVKPARVGSANTPVSGMPTRPCQECRHKGSGKAASFMRRGRERTMPVPFLAISVNPFDSAASLAANSRRIEVGGYEP
ncbi:hypothetical protein [Treponema endosymbiont of Eucomonympha sp.]|uniref:hypothetical protein n=1 Tax=Treponema endosymbiont of Eucomonympha sp. TaxID=1580831 RepID=UPI001396A0C4|nr:hypothetical protein [Treponema endosymbiont of Eucomonympha sp.]